MSVNYDRVCRLCLSSRGELLPIFPTTSSDDSEPPVLASKIKDCVDVQITENDDLPSNVCRKCVDNVHNWHIFKSVCERTQNKLQSLKDGSQLEEVNIKNEPLSDEAYDDGVVIDGSYPDSENAGTSNKVQPEGPPILASLGLTPRSDKKYVDPRMDWQRVHAILDIIQEDEVIDSLQYNEEENILQQSDHDSETDGELMSDVDDVYINTFDGYVCKDKQMISTLPKLSVSENNLKIKEVINLRKQSITHTLKHCPEPKHAWQLMFTDELLEYIVGATNKNIRKNGHEFSFFTKLGEIKTLIGILYMHGIMRPTHQKCRELWNDVCALTCVKKAMKYQRFKFLLENISFDTENSKFDVMKDMRKVFETFVVNCKASFDVGDIAVVDEIVVPVYGPCPFHYNSKKKPLKSGIKLVLLLNTSNFYVNNLDLITDSNSGPEHIVTKLVQHLAGTGRTIMMDSWFCSMSLMQTVKREYQLYCIAALNPKHDLIPPLFTSKYRKCKSYLTAFLDNDVTLTSYVNMDSKSVNVLTNCPKFYKKAQGYSTVVNEYKKKQSCVEVLDVLMNYYTTMQNSNDWRLSLFFTMLNIASINAQVIWSSQNASNIAQRRLFIKDLAVSLLETEEGQVESPGSEHAPYLPRENDSKTRRRCELCKSYKRQRKTRKRCIKCGKYTCGEHTRSLCVLCRI